MPFCPGVGRGEAAQKLPQKRGHLKDEWAGFCLAEEEEKVIPGVRSSVNKAMWHGLRLLSL